MKAECAVVGAVLACALVGSPAAALAGPPHPAKHHHARHATAHPAPGHHRAPGHPRHKPARLAKPVAHPRPQAHQPAPDIVPTSGTAYAVTTPSRPAVVPPAPRDWHRSATSHAPRATPGDTVRRAVLSSVRAAEQTVGFPVLLLVAALLFVFLHSLSDRRDSKLATASWASDRGLAFQPPPSRQ